MSSKRDCPHSPRTAIRLQPPAPQPPNRPSRRRSVSRNTRNLSPTQNPQASYDDWQDAKDEARYQWRVQHDLNQRLTDRFVPQQQAQTFQQALGAVQDKGRKADPDYDARCRTARAQSIPIARDIVDANNRFQFILQHPASEHLQYAIAKVAIWQVGCRGLESSLSLRWKWRNWPPAQEAPRSTWARLRLPVSAGE